MTLRIIAPFTTGGLVASLLLLSIGDAHAQAPSGTAPPPGAAAPGAAAPPGAPATPNGSGAATGAAPASATPSPLPPPAPPVTSGAASGTASSTTPGSAPSTPAETARPRLSLDQALERFNKHGFDLIVADAQVALAQADKTNLTAQINPTLSAGIGKTLGYDPSRGNGYDPSQPQTAANSPCNGCSEWSFNAGVTDNAAIMRFLAGKRELRTGVADAAIAAAKMNKEDARRTLGAQVKAAYVEVARAQASLDLAKEAADSWAKTLASFQLQDRIGKQGVDSGAVARIETAKIQADIAAEQASIAVDSAKYNLLFLLGDRKGQLTEFDVDTDTIKFAVPPKVNGATAETLLESARSTRPDLKVIVAQKDHAQQGIDLAKRERVPDIAVSLNYSQTGTGQNALSPPTVGLGLSIPLPVFYQNQGDIQHAQADLFQQETLEKKALSQIETDVRSAWKQYLSARSIVDRYETGRLLEQAQHAVSIVETQLKLGAPGLSIIDLLDARRTLISVKNDHVTQLANYWDAVFTLEQAVGADLRH